MIQKIRCINKLAVLRDGRIDLPTLRTRDGFEPILKSGSLFYYPTGLDIEMTNTGAFNNLEVYQANGQLFQTYHDANLHGGWRSFGQIAADCGAHDYKFRLVNASPGTRQVLQGALYTH